MIAANVSSPTRIRERRASPRSAAVTSSPRSFNRAVVPNKVPPVPPAAQLEKLTRLVTAARATVAPPVSHYVWLPRRQIRVAVTSYDPVPARIAGLDRELRAVADTVRNYVAA